MIRRGRAADVLALEVADFGWQVIAVLVALGVRDVLDFGFRYWRRKRRAASG